MPTIPVAARAGPPRPHAEAPFARRTAIVAFLFFLAASASLVIDGVNLHTLQRAFPLYALGGFGTLIFGTMRLLVAGMAGRDVVGGRASALATTLMSAVGAAGVYWAQDGAAAAALPWAVIWAAAAATHVVVTALTLRRTATRAPVTDPTATRRAWIPIRLLEVGALVYAAASALVVPLAYAGLASRASAVHVVLVGFVATTIMAVATQILPRFTRARIPTPMLALLVPFALLGPALMTLGLDRHRAWLPAGALVEGGAFAIFAAAMLSTLVRAHRKVRVPNAAYAAAPLFVGIGGLLALDFALNGARGQLLATHGLLNVFGFVGLVVIGASLDLYAPALEAGAAPAKRHGIVAIALTTSGLLLAAAGTWIQTDALARAGMLLYTLAIGWQLLGLASTHRRAGRVLTRWRER